jgi:glycosyltransferase involved in cell wall biosynthesis
LKETLGISPNDKVVSIIAILRNIKRHDLFMQAAQSIKKDFKDVKFLVVGDGPIQSTVEKQVAAFGLEQDVIMTGHRSDIPEIMAISDVVVLTSLMEGVPQVLTQAMAMERSVVAANVGGIPDLIIDGKTGIFARAGDAQSFAEKVGMLLRDDALRLKLGQVARQHILEHFTDDIMTEKTVAFYNHLLKMKLHNERS